MNKAIITYETIYEFLRNEKNKDELQKLSDTFFADVGRYLGEKEKIYDETKTKSDVFSKKELEKINVQLQNIRNILTEFYTRRELKIIELAINLVRTKSNIVDTTNIHRKEKQFFDDIVTLLEKYRSVNLKELLTAREVTEEPAPIQGKKVEFLASVDAFVDTDLTEFGPFSQTDTAVIPNEIAEILIAEGKAREI